MNTDTEKMSTIYTVGNWEEKKETGDKICQNECDLILKNMDVIMGKQNNLGRIYTETVKNAILLGEWNYEYCTSVL